MEHKANVKNSSPISSGLVNIFVQENDKGKHSKDILNINQCFEKLGLTVKPYIDKTASEIVKILKDDVMHKNIDAFDCFIVFIISHFIEFGNILSKRECDVSKEKDYYHEHDIIDVFKNHPAIIDKPKLFFFQVSRYQELELTELNQQSNKIDGNSTNQLTLPGEANILIFRSSYEAGPLHKPTNTGSWVIKKLCERLENLDGSVSLLEAITTLLNDIKSNRSGEPSLDPYKTLPEITSSLIQNVYFKSRDTVCASNRPSSYKKEKKMGRFYVFNYNFVWDPSLKVYLTRDGTKKDTKCIQRLFTSLGFEVVVNNDFTRDQLFDLLKKAPDFTDDTCVVIAVLTHGIDGLIGTGENSQIKEQDLYKELANRSDLIGKPKIFVFNFCRGNKSSSDVRVPCTNTVAKESSCTTTETGLDEVITVNTKKISATVGDENDVTNIGDLKKKNIVNDTKIGHTTEIPSINISPLEYDDILVLHSTYAESVAVRHSEEGSWFIQEMCSHLEKNTKNQEISLLEFAHEVHELIAKKDLIEINGEYFKQMPVTISTLTRRLMLGPCNNLNS